MKRSLARVEELLIDRATEGLDRGQEHELAGLLPRWPELDHEAFERAAAAIELAYTKVEEPLPPRLRIRILQRLRDYLASLNPSAEADEADEAASDTPREKAKVIAFTKEPIIRSRPAPSTLPIWGLAAAAIALAVVGWWPRGHDSALPDAATAHDTLILQAEDLIELKWTPTDDPAAVAASGELLWSTEHQQGFMRFRGLPVNDPAVEQYQLWIFDATQDERYPIDGGVFDITVTGEAVIAIDPKLAVTQPTLFAITIEKPGGVVVSSRRRLPLLAQVG